MRHSLKGKSHKVICAPDSGTAQTTLDIHRRNPISCAQAMNRTITVVLLWAASLAAVWFLARGSSDAPPAAPSPETKIVRTPASPQVVFIDSPRDATRDGDPEPAAGPDPDRTVSIASEPAADDAEAPRLSPADIARNLPAALNSSDPISQNLIVAHMLSQLTAGNARNMLSAFENSRRNTITDHHFRMFMFAWGRVDGRAAADYAFKNPEGRKVGWGGTAALSAWAEQDPGTVFEYLQQQDEGTAARMHRGFLLGYARADTDQAQRYVASLEPGRLRGESVDVLLHQHRESGDRHSLLDWATQTLAISDDPKYTRYVLEKTTIEAARDDGVALARWIDRHANSEHLSPNMFEEAADEWAESDPYAAAAWLERHMDDERVNSQVVGEFADEWAKTDPVGATTWLKERMATELVSPKVTGRAAGEWAANDPAAAVNWVASLPADKQATSYGYIARQWPLDDLGSAMDWINRAGDGRQYDSAREGLAYRVAGSDPVEAIRLASGITDNRARERSMVRSAQSLYRRDPEAIKAWLPVSGLSEESQRRILHGDGRSRRR